MGPPALYSARGFRLASPLGATEQTPQPLLLRCVRLRRRHRDLTPAATAALALPLARSPSRTQIPVVMSQSCWPVNARTCTSVGFPLFAMATSSAPPGAVVHARVSIHPYTCTHVHEAMYLEDLEARKGRARSIVRGRRTSTAVGQCPPTQSSTGCPSPFRRRRCSTRRHGRRHQRSARLGR